MVSEQMKHKIYFPYSDLQTRNLVLQAMEYGSPDRVRESIRRDYLASSLERLADNQEVARKTDASDIGAKLKELLEKKGKAFLHTPEYYASIEDEHERMKAYSSLVVSSAVPQGEEAEIAENPFRFLGLPQDATFGQTRAAWIRLSRMWFPDLMAPENSEQYRRIFGIEKFVIGETDYDSWLEKILKLTPPKVLSASDLEKLGIQEQEEYRQKHEAYRAKENEYERVKTEMRLRATRKMQIINKAYGEAKKRFKDTEEGTFAGFSWEKGVQKSHFLKTLMGIDGLEYNVLNLEGDGEVRRDFGRFARNSFPYLAFDFGDVYLADNDYRQGIYLRPFFVWTELVQGRELSLTLLDDTVDTYKLSDDKAEQLRLMVMNREEPEFVVTALGISRKDLQEYTLLNFLGEAYEGPRFHHEIGPLRESLSFPLGVEFTPQGGLLFKYMSQEDQNFSWFSTEETAHFSPIDVQMMLVIAYGPMLQGPKG